MLYLQSTEVKNANAMELESLKRQVAYLEESNVEVKKLSQTDIHKYQLTWLGKDQISNMLMMSGI